MHRQEHRSADGWAVWIVLLGMTGLGSLWVNDSHRGRRDLPALDDSDGNFVRDGIPHDDIAPPRIVFPGVDEDAGDDFHFDNRG